MSLVGHRPTSSRWSGLRRGAAPLVALAAVLAVALSSGAPAEVPTRRIDAQLVTFNNPAPPVVDQPAVLDARIHVTWTAPNEDKIRGYVVAYTPSGGSTTTMAETANAYADISSASNGTSYTITVRTVTYNGDLVTLSARGPFTGTTAGTASVTPAVLPPTALSATPADRQVALSWTAPADTSASSYQVYRGGTLVQTQSSSTRTWTNTGLVNGTSYTWTVRAVYSSTGHTSADSTAVTSTPRDAVAPAAPTGLTAVRGDSSVALSWTANAEYDVASYSVLRDGVVVGTTAAGTTAHTDTGLVNDRAYSYTLKATDTSSNTSAASTPAVSATPTDLTPPAAPTGLSAARGDGRVVLTWTAGAESDLASYQVLRGGVVIATVTRPATTFTDTGLTNDTQYQYSLKAVDTHGNASAASTPAVSATPTDLTPPAVPTGLTAVRGDGQVALSWTAGTESDLASYQVLRGGAVVATVTRPSTAFTDTGLTNDTAYSYTIRAVDTHGNASAISSPAVSATPTDLTAPAVPTGLAAARGDGRVVLSWTANTESDLASYQVLRGGAVVATVNAPAIGYTDTGLTNDTTYGYTITAVDTHGNASAASSPAVSATPTDLTAPAVPTGLTAARGDGRVVLTWTANTESDLASYKVVRNMAVIAVVTAPTTTYTDTDVTNDSQYRYALVAVDTHGNQSALSTPPVRATPTDLTPPAVPTGLTALRGDGRVTLAWTANGESDLASYQVVRDGAVVATVTGPATGYTDTGLTNDRTYAYALAAVDTHGNASAASTPVVEATPTDLTAPAAPTALTATRGDGRVTLAWTAGTESDLASYQVLRDGAVVATVTKPATTYADTGLTNDTAYAYRLVAVDTHGNASPASSPAVSATPTDLTPPAVPTGLSATRGDGRVTLAWTANTESDLASYQVLRGGAVVATVTAPSTTYADTGLTNDTAYSYTIRAVDTHGNASAISSPAVSATPTDLTPPGVPAGLTAARGDGRVVLSWTANTESDLASYRVLRDGAVVATVTAPTTTYTDTGLTNDSTHTYALVAVDTHGNASAASSPAVSATPTDLTPPVVPAGLTAARGDGRVTLTWTASTDSDLAGYRVLRDGAVVATVTAPTTGYTDTGLTNDRTYSYALVAVDTHGNASAASSPAVSATPTDLTPPAAPTGLTTTPGDGTVVVAWTAGTEADLATYRVYRDGVLVATVTHPTATWTDTGLVNGAAHTYAVTAVDAHGNESPRSGSTSGSAADSVAPAAPATPTATRADGRVVLGWTPSPETDLAGYRVLRDGLEVATLPAGTTSWTDSGLTNGQVHQYQVVAVDTSGNRSAPSAALSTSAADAVAPGAPTAVSATAGSASATVRWTPPADTDLATYQVRRSDGTVVATVAAPATSVVVTGLVNGTAVTLTVVVVDTSGNPSAASASVTVTPVAPVVATVPAGGSGTTGGLAVSRDGRWLVVSTTARLESTDTNSSDELYRLDTTGAVPPRRVAPITASSGATTSSQGSEVALSSDGRYVVLTTRDGLVSADRNGQLDVYRADLSTTPPTYALVSVPGTASGSSAGTVSSGAGALPGVAVSADGQRVLFSSDRTDLVPAGRASGTGVYAKDLTGSAPSSGPVVLVSTATGGATLSRAPTGSALALTADGRYALFTAVGAATGDAVYRKDLVATTAGAASGTGDLLLTSSTAPVGGAQTEVGASRGFGQLSMSDDGRYVALLSSAKLTSATPTATGSTSTAYRKDLTTGAVLAIGAPASGVSEQQLSLSPDGGSASFTTAAALVSSDTNGRPDTYRRDLASSSLVLVTSDASGAAVAAPPVATDSGRVVDLGGSGVVVLTVQPLVPSDTNRLRDVYRKDLTSGAVTALVTG